MKVIIVIVAAGGFLSFIPAVAVKLKVVSAIRIRAAAKKLWGYFFIYGRLKDDFFKR